MSYTISLTTDFQRNSHKGLYIALEGIDGSGKTTQVAQLKKYFIKKGKEVILTREPRKVGIIAEINAKALEGKINLPSEAYQYLFTVDRILNHRDVVLPALKRGAVVITDRCFWSAVAYGMWDMGKQSRVDVAKRIMIAQGLLAMQIQFTVPDLTLYLSLKPTIASKRLEEIDKKKEIYENDAALRIVSQTYDWLLNEFPKEFHSINANKSIDEVTDDMIQVIEKNTANK